MTFQIEEAKKAGYSDEEISDFLSKQHPDFDFKKAQQSGYSLNEITEFLSKKPQKESLGKRALKGAKQFLTENAPKESFLKELTRTAAQPVLGALEFHPAALTSSLLQMFGTGEALSELEELEERLPQLRKEFPDLNIPEKIDREKYMEALETASKLIPTISNISELAEEKTGVPLTPKTPVQKTLRFMSNISKIAKGTPSEKIFKGIKGEAVKNALMSQGVPEDTAEIVAIPYALFEKTKVPKTEKKKQITEKPKVEVLTHEQPPTLTEKPPSEPPFKGIPKIEIEKYPSGLTKLKAAEKEVPKGTLISSKRQEQVISNLNKEASELTKKTIEKHLPIAKQIEEGFDFEHAFEKGFNELKATAEKFNPDINTGPLNKFLRSTYDEFRGIPTPHPEARKIIREIRNYSKNPQLELGSLLRIFRSNGKKIKSIYETARLTGSQQEYVDFLLNMNKKIKESIKGTLPEDSAWVKQFETLNKVYSGWKNAQKMNSLLRPILEGNPTYSNIKKIASDPKVQKRLELSMGKEGAKEIIQVSKDLQEAHNSINKIPIKDLKTLDAIFPLQYIIFSKVPGVGFIKKGVDWLRTGYGYYLTTPATRIHYDNALKAIIENNPKSYKTATDAIKKDIGLIEYKPKE